MIEFIEFENFRNLNGKYVFDNQNLNIIFGSNNSGKTNILDGIRLAFSSISNEHFKIQKTDFADSDDSKLITIKVSLKNLSISSLEYIENNIQKCGFKIEIIKTRSGRYTRRFTLLNGTPIDLESVRDDPNLPNVCILPLIRSEDLYNEDLIVGISHFIQDEKKYKNLIEQSKTAIRDQMKDSIKGFQDFCDKFNQKLDIDFTPPKIVDEKAYVIGGDKEKEHSRKIGSGYKSLATIILNTLNDKHNIILIDEIENHMHPSMIRTLIDEFKTRENVEIIATTHSPIILNEMPIEGLISSKGIKLTSLKEDNVKKLDAFLHPGRAELIFNENIVLVEGYSEEIILRNYVLRKKLNWTIVNVSGVMFEPYIDLGYVLKKNLIVVSDTDISTTDGEIPSSRFKKLESFCNEKGIKLLSMYNTLETDLYNNNFISIDDLKQHDLYDKLFVAKSGKKTEIAMKLVESNADLSNWHIVKEIENEFTSN